MQRPSSHMFSFAATIWKTRVRVRQQREQQQRLRDTLTCVDGAVIVTDARGTVTGMNLAAESMTGWKDADAIGQPIGAIFRLVDAHTCRPVANPVVKALYKGVVVGPSMDTLLISKDGAQWNVREISSPIRDDAGQVCAAAIAFRAQPVQDAATSLHTSRMIRIPVSEPARTFGAACVS